MVNTAFALKFTTPCKKASKCGIFHLCFCLPPSLHFFAPYLHLVNLCTSNFSCRVLDGSWVSLSAKSSLRELNFTKAGVSEGRQCK